MKKMMFLTLSTLLMGVVHADGMDCSPMSPEVQQFASQLTMENKMVFCGKMTDEQRATAMQMSATMSPDDAVQKASTPATPIKPPAGCPVK